MCMNMKKNEIIAFRRMYIKCKIKYLLFFFYFLLFLLTQGTHVILLVKEKKIKENENKRKFILKNIKLH